MKMEVSVLQLLERTSALWMQAGGNLANSRFREVLFLDVRLPRGFVEEPQGGWKILVAEAPEAEARRREGVGVDEGIIPVRQSIEVC